MRPVNGGWKHFEGTWLFGFVSDNVFTIHAFSPWTNL